MQKFLNVFEPNLEKYFVAYAVIFIAVALFGPVIGDYCPYVQQWRNIWDGLDPWLRDDAQVVHHISWLNICGPFFISAPNAYGPLFNVYGLTSILFPTLPRLLGCILYLSIAWLIAEKIRARRELSPPTRVGLYVGLLANALSFALVAVIGSNDVYIAFFVCWALIALEQGRDGLAGAALGLGALVKFYPLYLVPFLAIDRGRLRIKFVGVAAVIFALGMALAYAKWGVLVFKPLTWNLGRNATRSSLIFIIDTVLQSAFHVSVPASRTVLLCLIPAAAAALSAQYLLRLSSLTGFMIGYIIILTLNQIGYPEYYFPLMLATFLYVVDENPPADVNWALAVFVVAIVLDAAFFGVATNYMKEAFSGLRVFLTLVLALINIWVIGKLLRTRESAPVSAD
jgi:hypothetical protein